MKKKLFSTITSFLAMLLVLTVNHNSFSQGPCGFDEMMGELVGDGHFSGIPWLNELENTHQAKIQYMIDNDISVDVTIPVVVHVVHENGEGVGQDYNIFQSRVLTAINSLNMDFQGTGIQFCPAKRYPDGTPLAEEGVVRVNASSIQGYNSSGVTMNGDSDNELKLSGPQFSSYDYLNIWTVKNISASGSGQVLGYASFPLQTAKHMDGITMDTDHFGISNWRVVTHEVGHYLRLYHTFNGDDPDYDGANFVCPQGQGDMVDDTAPHIRSASGTCPTGTNECNNDSPLANIVNNHMDYSDESCRTNFTDDQIIRMQACILAFRYGLLNPLGCEAGCNPIFSAEFSSFPEQPQAPDDNGNNAESGEFTAVNQSLSSYEWFINGVSATDMDGIDQILNYEFQSSGFYQVCLRGTLNGCSIDYCQEITVLDAGLCKQPIIDPCEILINGNFDESIPFNTAYSEENFSVVNKRFNSLSNLTVINKTCNWKNALGWHELAKWNLEEDFFFFFVGFGARSMGIQTLSPLELVDGVEYEVTFDMAVQDNPETPQFKEVYFALVEDGFWNNSHSNWGSFDHETIEKVKSFGIDEVTILDENQSEFEKSDFDNYSFHFTYSNDLPKYLFLSKNHHGSNFKMIIDNISIKQCDFCAAIPQMSYNADCESFQFFGQNLNANSGGIPSWSINGYTIPQSVGNYDFDFSFPWFGEYDVCFDITCDNGVTSSSCINVAPETLTNEVIITLPDGSTESTGIACEVCQNPTVYTVDAQRCGDDSKEFLVESFPISVDKGFRPCLGDFGLTEVFNGTITTNDYYVDESNPFEDIIHVSFTFIADDLNQQMGALFAMCSPDGSKSECFRFEINHTRTCDSCEGEENIIVSNMNVECTDSNINDGVVEYTGRFDIQLPPINGPYQECGSISSNSGLNTNSISSTSPNSFSIAFSLATNQLGSFSSSVTLCFFNGAGEQICYDINIVVDDPCIPDTDNCEVEVLPITLACDRTDGDNAVYIFPSAVHLPNLIKEGWVYCDNDPVTGDFISDREPIGLYGDPLLTVEGSGAYLFGVELTIPCEDVRNGNMITSIFLNLCNEDRVMCVEVPLILECTDCGSGKHEGRRSNRREDQYALYPVPASESIIIAIPMESEQTQYSIYSPSGKIVNKGILSAGENVLETSTLSNGLYYITIFDTIQNVRKKIIIID